MSKVEWKSGMRIEIERRARKGTVRIKASACVSSYVVRRRERHDGVRMALPKS